LYSAEKALAKVQRKDQELEEREQRLTLVTKQLERMEEELARRTAQAQRMQEVLITKHKVSRLQVLQLAQVHTSLT
jgi:hypothetical protein